ncbi:hypothetical protein D5041_20085 [Verminephrobacter aporrectodeae subsp. tuberculatae]|nr:hypothetical protein [Verminephrobacter aporrectodeae subsp. tuberculatae]MCW5291242.1 hypothetical protein [Verminephrobacter aporrectodeae subsp. tuberculatae]
MVSVQVSIRYPASPRVARRPPIWLSTGSRAMDSTWQAMASHAAPTGSAGKSFTAMAPVRKIDYG